MQSLVERGLRWQKSWDASSLKCLPRTTRMLRKCSAMWFVGFGGSDSNSNVVKRRMIVETLEFSRSLSVEARGTVVSISLDVPLSTSFLRGCSLNRDVLDDRDWKWLLERGSVTKTPVLSRDGQLFLCHDRWRAKIIVYIYRSAFLFSFSSSSRFVLFVRPSHSPVTGR